MLKLIIGILAGVTVGVAVPALASTADVCTTYSPYYAGESAYNHYYWAINDSSRQAWSLLSPAQRSPWIQAGSAAIDNACLHA